MTARYPALSRLLGRWGMYATDTIADMLTRIRNANLAKATVTQIPFSKMNNEIARVLYETGFISEYKAQDIDSRKYLRVYLKYSGNKRGVITGIRRISKSGRRVYVGTDEIPRVLRGMGVIIISTPKGVMTGHQAVKEHQGGEVLAAVW